MADHASGWDRIIEMTRGSSRPPTSQKAGLWAVGVLRDALGEAWPQRHLAVHGYLPAFLSYAGGHNVAFQEQLELAARLSRLQTVPGFAKVRKELRSDVVPTRLLHTQLQLELGDLGIASGETVAFEHGAGSPADVTVGALTFEAVVVTPDERFRNAQEYSDRISGELWRLRMLHDIEIDGALPDRLDEQRTFRLLVALDTAARLARTSGKPVDVPTGDGNVTIRPSSIGDRATFEGPVMVGADWTRTAARLRGKAIQASRSGAGWLRVDLRDGTFGFSPWYAQHLSARTEMLAVTIRETLIDTDLDGVVVSSGALGPVYTLDAETYAHPDAYSGEAYWIGPGRARELYTIALTDRGREQTPMVRGLYAHEPPALEKHLTAIGLGALPELMV